jgi:hypothetical protein
MTYRQTILMAMFFGLALGVLVCVISELYDERPTPRPVPARDEVPPADISALHEEIRKIQRDADDS